MANFYGSSNADSLTSGTLGDDWFYAGLGSDYIAASGGNDIIYGGFATSASYWRYGFNDFDTVDYRNAYLSLVLRVIAGSPTRLPPHSIALSAQRLLIVISA